MDTYSISERVPRYFLGTVYIFDGTGVKSPLRLAQSLQGRVLELYDMYEGFDCDQGENKIG